MGLFNENAKHIKRITKIAQKVFTLEEEYKRLTDDQLKEHTQMLKAELAAGKTLNDILPQAFATVREAAWRVLGLRPYDEQIMGGICLHQGRIAEMKTGEGKTLVATLPCYLNALTGSGVHVVTVNDYLAKRDAEWMGKVHRFLGLTVGVVLAQQPPQIKKRAYDCDITYCTNSELGFDYLRDNLVGHAKDRVLRGLNFCLIDEIDSILIDEARTPLIISGQGQKPTDIYTKADDFVRTLTKDDYVLDEKDSSAKQIRLSDAGVAKAEQYYGVENLGDIENIELHHYVNNALRAHCIMKLDDNYIVDNGEIVIVDEFTGRTMRGRRFSKGLHQAIEAKERVEIKNESQTLATITYQNLFRMYKKLSGMTGTAKTEEAEFNRIYNLDVVVMPTHLALARIDENDIVYKTLKGKYEAIVADVADCAERGQPVLVGVASIDRSETISRLLAAAKIKHTVLNAKNHELEGEIIAQAGRKGSVTVATNMAGRGTDILLGGNAEYLTKREMREKGFEEEVISAVSSYKTEYSEEEQGAKKVYDELLAKNKKITAAEKEEVLELGGLRIVGTERHESRRIDNQLRGRSGRQGDRGSSVFYLSLEDDLVRRFGGERLQRLLDFFRIDENTPFQFRSLARQIRNAQRKIEGLNFTVRRNVLEFDDVMNRQRTIIYAERNKVLDGLSVRDEVLKMFDPVIAEAVYEVISDNQSSDQWDLDKLNASLERACMKEGTSYFTKEKVTAYDAQDVIDEAVKEVIRQYEERAKECEEVGIPFADIERSILLNAVTRNWTNHIDAMQILKDEIHLKGIGQQDPILAYKKEGFEMFDKMTENIQNEVARLLINMRITRETNERLNEERNAQTAKLDVRGQIVKDKSIRRNDRCPCGSGQKYKNCCGK